MTGQREIQVPLVAFDYLASRGKFSSGPEIETPDRHEPYRPYLRVQGTLRDGTRVWAKKYDQGDARNGVAE
jgi:hypothetical protein